MTLNVYKLCLSIKVMRKDREQIAQLILSSLEQKPLSTQQISEKVKSNWITINEVLEELKTEEKVREIIATDKIKIYQKITGDTYYSIPITREQREYYRFLFSLAINEYKNQKNRIPKKTELAKIVVDTVKEASLDLPVVWYLYGQIPLMVSDPVRDYSTSFTPNNFDQIKKIVSKNVKEQNYENTHKLKTDHYKKYSNSFYEIKENLLFELGGEEDPKKILDCFNLFYMRCPSENPQIFNYVEKLYSLANKLELENALIKNKVKVIVALEAVWGLIATYTMIDSLSQYPQYPKEEIIQYYLGSTVETKKNCAQEATSNLQSIYLNNLTEKEIDLPEEIISTREVMSDWTGK